MAVELQDREATVDAGEKAPSGLPPPANALAMAGPLVTKPNLGRIVAAATIVVSLLLMISITVGMAAAEPTGWIDGFGVAVFAAFWGGPGFGLVFGGAYWIYRQERWEAQQTTLGTTTGI